MPTTIKLRNSVTTTNAPSSLVQGEVAINITDKKVWVGNAATTPIQLLGDGGSASFTSIAFGAGTVSNPSITFTGDTNTGIYSPAADTIAFAEGGVEGLRINSNGQTSTSIAGTASLPSFTRTGDENTGIYFPAADTIAFTEGGVESMRIDSSGNVGIGTTTPTTGTLNRQLTINSGATNLAGIVLQNNATGTAFNNGTTINILNGTDFQIFNQQSGFISFGTNNTERMRIDSSGNVGIGTSSPSQRFHVSGGFSLLNGLRISGADTNNTIYQASGDFSLSSDGGNVQVLVNPAGAYFRVLTGGQNERMRIDSSGNVGIGTSSPSSYNASADNLVVAGSVDSGITIASGTTSTGYVIFADGTTGTDAYTGYIGYNHGSNYMQFHTNGGTERMRITSGGQVLVGSTGADGNLGATGFQVTSAETAAIVRVTNASGQAMRFFTSTTTQAGFITVNGTTTTYNSASDYRLKDNVQPLTNALDTVAKLKPVTFTWKHDGRDDNGFIAHELQEVLPNAVTGDKDAVNKDGSIQAQGIDQRNIVATLTAAIQEQQAMIEELKQEVALLKSK